MNRALLVDGDQQLLRRLASTLESHDYLVETALDAASAVAAAQLFVPDITLLDIGLPGMDGVDVIGQLRRISAAPIVVLSAQEARHTKIAALDAGADDYLTKPFDVEELLARLRSALRRAAPTVGYGVVQTNGFRIDFDAGRAMTADGEVKLTPTEWRLLAALTRRPRTLITHRQLLQEVWGPAYGKETHYVRVFVAQLRRKLERHPSAPAHFVTEHGMGYRFEP